MSYVSLYVRKEVSYTTFSENLISSSTPLLFSSFCCCICYEVWGPMNWYCQRGLRSTPWEIDLSSETCSDKLEKTVRDLQKCSDVCVLIGNKVHRLEGESVVLVSFKFVCEMWVCVCVRLLTYSASASRENERTAMRSVVWPSCKDTDTDDGESTQTPPPKRLDV